MTEIEYFRQECSAYFAAVFKNEPKRLVFGEGTAKRPVLMLIGEAPGEQEALQGRPFVGKAGKNLDVFLQTLHLEREEIYISNVVKVRPSEISAAGRVVNRPPSREEKALFTPWLMKEIAIVKPGALVTLGNVALQAFVEDTIGNRHGRWSSAEIRPPLGEAFSLPLFALYHPASIIYNASLKTTYETDLANLAQSLADNRNAEMDI